MSEPIQVRVRELADRYIVTDKEGNELSDEIGFTYPEYAREWAVREGYEVEE